MKCVYVCVCVARAALGACTLGFRRACLSPSFNPSIITWVQVLCYLFLVAAFCIYIYIYTGIYKAFSLYIYIYGICF